MRCLIVEDDINACKLLGTYLSKFAECIIAIDGLEGVKSFTRALDENNPFDLICLDIMLPEMNGDDVLKNIRQIEQERHIVGPNRVKVIMTTALTNFNNIAESFRTGCEGYIIKPIRKNKLFEEIEKLGLLKDNKPVIST